MSDEFQCLCHHCHGTAEKPCLNLERTNDREWVIKKLDAKADALEARVRELEEAMPDAGLLRRIAYEFGEDVGEHRHFFYVLHKMADLIEKAMKK